MLHHTAGRFGLPTQGTQSLRLVRKETETNEGLGTVVEPGPGTEHCLLRLVATLLFKIPQVNTVVRVAEKSRNVAHA